MFVFETQNFDIFTRILIVKTLNSCFCTNVFYGKIENRDQGDSNATNYDIMQGAQK